MIEYKVKVQDNGTREWFNLNGLLHRVDGPAIEHANGDKWWYLNDQRHRVDGPAIEHANGNKRWYLNGKKYSEAEWKLAVAKLNKQSDPCDGKEVSIDGKMYKLTAI